MRHLSLGTLALLACAFAPQASAQGIPLFGQTTRDCLNPVDLEAVGGELYGIKTSRLDPSPDVLFDAHASGGGDGLAVLDQDTYSVDSRWHASPNIQSRVAIVLTLPGEAMIENADFSSPSLGAAQPQSVGTIDGTRPGVVASTWGYTVRFHPLKQQTPDISFACAIAGSPLTDYRPVLGYAVYRLQGTSNPPLSQFRTGGYVGFIDLRTMSFSVADADGLGCADLAGGDEAWLENPNGLLDDGDEVIVFRDTSRTPSGRIRPGAPDPRQPQLYRLQPIIIGDPVYYDFTHVFGDWSLPVSAADRDGNGTDESLDFLSDGRFEFVDPGRHGMGLTWSGEILSSPLPGQGTPGAAPVDPDGDGIPSADEILLGLSPSVSNATTDSDGDGVLDPLEAESGSTPTNPDGDGSGERDGREMFYGRSPINRCDDVVLGARPLGDISPPGGDGLVNIGDAVRMLRMAVGIETPTPLELTVGDVGPAELANGATNPPTWRRHGVPDGLGQHPYGYFEHGDGVLNVSDAVVILRQSVGLQTVTD